MPLSVVIDQDSFENAVKSSYGKIEGVWVNSDVNVFIPQFVIDEIIKVSSMPVLSQGEAVDLFFKIYEVWQTNPEIFNSWEGQFIPKVNDDIMSESKFLSAKQKSKIKQIYEDYEAKFDELYQTSESNSEAMDDIPF